MGLSVATIDITSPTSTGNQTYTTGFQAKIIIIVGTNASATGTNSSDALYIGYGVSSSSYFCMGITGTDAKGSGSDNQFSWQDPAQIVKFFTGDTGSTTVIIAATVNSITSTQVVLNWGTVSATARKLTMICIGGSDISGAEIVNFQTPSSTGTQNVATTLGTPIAAFFLGVGSGVNTAGTVTSSKLMSGFSFGSSDNHVTSAQFASSVGLELTNQCIAVSGGLTTIDSKAAVTGFTNNNIALNWTTVYTTTRYYYFGLVVYGTATFAGFSNTTPTSTGNKTTTLTGNPLFAWNQTIGQAASSSLITSAVNCLSVGLYDGTNSRVHAISDIAQHGKANSTGKAYFQTTEAMEIYDNTDTTPVKLVEAVGNGLVSGVTYNFTTVNATAREFVGWAINAAAGGATPPLFRQSSLNGLQVGGPFFANPIGDRPRHIIVCEKKLIVPRRKQIIVPITVA